MKDVRIGPELDIQLNELADPGVQCQHASELMESVPNNAADLLTEYSDAPASMPAVVREIAEGELGGAVIFYALSDLDSDFRFRRLWVVLGRDAIAFIREPEPGNETRPHLTEKIERCEIGEVRTTDGLSCSTISLVGAANGDELAAIRFTRRHHEAFETFRAAVELGDSGEMIADSEAADDAYRESVVGSLMSVQPGVAASGFRVIRRLVGYLAPYKRQVVLGVGAAALVALVGLAPPYLTGRLLDSILGIDGDSGLVRGVWTFVSLITAAVLARAVFLWIRLHLMSVLGEKVARDLRRDVYGHVQNLSLGYFSKTQTGSVVSRVGSDTDRIWEFITFGLAEAVLSAFTLVSIGIVLLILDWRLGAIMLVPIPILLWAIIRNGRGIQKGFTKAWRRWAALNAVIAGTIPGIRVVKGFGQEDRERERFENENRGVYETFNEVHASWTRFWPALVLALHGIGLAVYWVALPRLGGSGIALTPGTFVSFLLFSWMFVQPVESFAQMGRMVNRALSSARRVFELLDTEPEEKATGGIEPEKPVRGEIEFADVWFGYQRFRPVLRGVSFRVAAGEVIGIAGRSGAGKSTLIQLIPRFFEADGGRITLDGTDISDFDIRALRREIGIVDQDPFLFHGTVLENIRYGKPDASPDEVIEAARVADAHSFVCGLPLGYETVVGERGHTLSGGERQRISLARTLLPKPRILIFDEATSNVDGESEARIQRSLGEVTAGCTTFVIGHRLAALRRADRILVLDEGEIRGEGSFEELAESNATFRRLYGDQLGIAKGEETTR